MRTYLTKDTIIRLPSGECYQITLDQPIGEGGGGIIYDSVRFYPGEEGSFSYHSNALHYAIKECFPVSARYDYERSERGEILPSDCLAADCSDKSGESVKTENDKKESSYNYLALAKKKQLEEMSITGQIYKKGFRLTPILSGVDTCELSFDGGQTFHQVENTLTIMESLSDKGRSLKSYMKDGEKLTLLQAFRTMEQILLAVDEVHEAGYLHLDLQDGNIFIKGQLKENNDFATLIDFGAARKREEDGYCAPVADQMIFTTEGFTAPEIIFQNDGSLRLGVEADIFSLGYLLLYMILGKKINPKDIYGNKSGKFLSGFRMRSIKCPIHLRDRLNDLLGKMLAYNPSDRYHSVHELLEDIREFLASLQPYRAKIADVKYDAFICYRHGPVDSEAAKNLQTWLEHYRLPKGAGYEKSGIGRVFVDEGELSSCADFGDQIREALKNAGWLIVICSPGTKESPWVNLEIDTFLQYHDRSRILAVMTEGEPEDVFPDQMKGSKKGSYDEVLAADARAVDKAGVMKRLKKEALPKLVAPMLGTTLDSIIQRRKNYVLRRALIAFGLSFAVMLGFISYILWQGRQVEEQYQNARKNQARYLASAALDVFNKGDRIKSLLLSLAISPKHDEDGAVVPEQMYSLSKALYAYKTDRLTEYGPTYMGQAEGITQGDLSPEGGYYIGIDKEENVVILDGTTGELLKKIKPEDIEGLVKDSSSDYQFKFVIPVSESHALLFSNGKMIYWDVKQNEKMYMVDCEVRYPTENNFDIYEKDQEKLIVLASSEEFCVYDLADGHLIRKLDLNKNERTTHIEYTINSTVFGKNGQDIYLGLSARYFYNTTYGGTNETNSDEYKHLSEEFFKHNKAMGLASYSLSDGKWTVLSEEETSNILLSGDQYLAVIHNKEMGEDVLSEDTWGSETVTNWLAIYDLEKKEEINHSDGFALTGNYGMSSGKLKIDGEERDVVYCWMKETLLIIDMKMKKQYTSMSFNSIIRNVCDYGASSCLIGFADGYALKLNLDGEISRIRVLNTDNYVNSFIFNKDKDVIIQLMSGDLVFNNRTNDPGMHILDITAEEGAASNEEYIIKKVEYADLDGVSYRYFLLGKDSNNSRIMVYRSCSEDMIYSFACDDQKDDICNIAFRRVQGKDWLAFFVRKNDETSSSSTYVFYKIDLINQEIVICEDLSPYCEGGSIEISQRVEYGSEMEYFLVKHDKGVVMFDISGNKAVPYGRVISRDLDVRFFHVSRDGKYLVMEGEVGTENQIRIYDIEQGEYIKDNIPCPDTIDWDDDFIMGKESDCVVFFDGRGKMTKYDLATGECLSEFDFEIRDINHFEYDLFDNDEYVIMTDAESLRLWNIERGELMMSYDLGENYFSYYVSTGPGSRYIVGKDESFSENISRDTGMRKQAMTIFYVDELYQFYPVCDVNYGKFDFGSEEVAVECANAIAWTGLYDYKQLKAMAKDVIKDQTLSPADKKEYFISDNP